MNKKTSGIAIASALFLGLTISGYANAAIVKYTLTSPGIQSGPACNPRISHGECAVFIAKNPQYNTQTKQFSFKMPAGYANQKTQWQTVTLNAFDKNGVSITKEVNGSRTATITTTYSSQKITMNQSVVDSAKPASQKPWYILQGVIFIAGVPS